MGMRPSSPSPSRRTGRLPLTAAGLVVLLLAQGAAAALIQQVRTWSGPEKTRIVVDLSGPTAYLAERHADVLTVTLPGSIFADEGADRLDDGRVLVATRRQAGGDAVLELALATGTAFRHFALPAADGRPDRIVVDVRPAPVPTSSPKPGPGAVAAPAEPETLVVMVDAGHGGQDPGAIRDGLREKDLTLDIARELARLLDEEPGLKAELTRDDDRTLKLADRVRLAESAGADLFVSIHANTADRADLRGLVAYFLAEAGSGEREERLLEDDRQAARVLGLDPAAAADPDVLPILMDLRRVSVADRSRDLAERILAAARRSDTLEARKVKQDDFHVLQSLAMPSALVEAAYMTNPDDLALLSTPRGRRAIAAVIRDGVADYVAARRGGEGAAVQGWTTWYAVRNGDNLWELARRHGTTVREILDRNHMDSDRLAVGQTLNLP